MRDHHRKIMAFLREQGADVRLVKGGKHVKLYFDLNGVRRLFVTSASPSDFRATANAISNLRRIIRNQTAARIK